MSKISRYVAVMLLAAVPAAAQDFSQWSQAQDWISRAIKHFRAEQKKAPSPKRAAAEAGPFARHLSCYNSMGGAMTRDERTGESYARVSGQAGGVSGVFVFNASSMEFQPKDPRSEVRLTGEGRVEAFNGALTSTVRAALAIDPGGYEMSSCGALEPRLPPTDY